jgi:hypothetical protein
MSLLIGVGMVAVACLVVVCAAALVEVFRQLNEIRRALNLQDLPTPLGLKGGNLFTSDFGLPETLATQPEAIVVFLSAKCTTCLAVAEAFEGGSPASVWFVLSSPPFPTNLLTVLSDSAERVVVDENDRIADGIHLHVTPSVLSVVFGEVTRAQAVASPRQVVGLIPTVASFRSESKGSHELENGAAQASLGGGGGRP